MNTKKMKKAETMIQHFAIMNERGVCAALTVKFVEAAMRGNLSKFNQYSLNNDFPSVLRSQFGSSFFALQSSGTKGNFELASSHLSPIVLPVRSPSKGFAFETALEVAIAKAASALVNTVAIEMYGDGGHVVGLKIVDGGTSSFFDANAGLYQFLSLDDLKNFCLGAYAIADYHFIRFNVVSFGKMPHA